jgi:ribosomal-protein-serine acetyltransferase
MEPDPPGKPTLRVIDLGDGLALHPASTGDAAELFAAIDRNRARLRQWLPWIPDEYAFHDALRFLEQAVGQNAEGSALTMLIRSDGKISGAIGLHKIDYLNRATSIGYWIGVECEGRGFMTRACRAMLDLAFVTYGLHRIEIRCATGNARSAAIPLRLGFSEEGTLHEAEWLYDHWVDLRVFGLIVVNWKKVSP